MPPQSNSLDFYSIACGVFQYDKKRSGTTCNWTERMDSPNGFEQNIDRSYYKNYVQNIFKSPVGKPDETQTPFLEHNTLKSLIHTPLTGEVSADRILISIPYFDCFLFTRGIGVFCFKVILTNPEAASYEDISRLLSSLRNPASYLMMGGTEITVSEFVKKMLNEGNEIPADWNAHLNQLKLYTIINDESLLNFTEKEEATIFELSHMMPIGTIERNLRDKPTAAYYQNVLTKNLIAVYGNWRAISLLDTFTRCSYDYPDVFKSWEFEYFHIYVYCLYCKFQLYLFNSQLTNLLEFNRRTHSIRNRFIEFVNDYSLPYISYKFLPNLLYEKMSASLEIQKELDAMERKTNRLNEGYQNKKSQQSNRLLLVISILSVASVLNDVSEWLSNTGVSKNLVYNPISIVSAVAILSTSLWLMFRSR